MSVVAGSGPLDIVTILLSVGEDSRIEELAFEGEKHTISQAESSLATELFEGKTIDGIEMISATAVLDILGREIATTRSKVCAAWFGHGQGGRTPIQGFSFAVMADARSGERYVRFS